MEEEWLRGEVILHSGTSLLRAAEEEAGAERLVF